MLLVKFHSGLTHDEVVQNLAAGIPDSRFVQLESQNHILLAHEPAWQVFLREVRSFLGVDSTPTVEKDASPWAWSRERRVAQWSVGYLTAAWLLLQLIGEIEGPWNLPAWTVRAAQVTLLIGFPIAVAAAWLTGSRVRRAR